jgi:hypothetical protein
VSRKISHRPPPPTRSNVFRVLRPENRLACRPGARDTPRRREFTVPTDDATAADHIILLLLYYTLPMTTTTTTIIIIVIIYVRVGALVRFDSRARAGAAHAAAYHTERRGNRCGNHFSSRTFYTRTRRAARRPLGTECIICRTVCVRVRGQCVCVYAPRVSPKMVNTTRAASARARSRAYRPAAADAADIFQLCYTLCPRHGCILFGRAGGWSGDLPRGKLEIRALVLSDFRD